MSFLGFGRPQPTSAGRITAVETEMKLMSQMHNRLTKACAEKCVPNDYREGDLNKGESVCLDRCAAEFFDVQLRVSELMQQEAQSVQARGAPAATAGGGGGGGGGLGFGA